MTHEPGRTTHRLKTWPEYFEAVERGTKTFELRKNDRDFQVGDILILEEWDSEKYLREVDLELPHIAERRAYTGRTVTRHVSYVLTGGPWLADGYAVLGIQELAQ